MDDPKDNAVLSVERYRHSVGSDDWFAVCKLLRGHKRYSNLTSLASWRNCCRMGYLVTRKQPCEMKEAALLTLHDKRGRRGLQQQPSNRGNHRLIGYGAGHIRQTNSMQWSSSLCMAVEQSGSRAVVLITIGRVSQDRLRPVLNQHHLSNTRHSAGSMKQTPLL
jgi:hypothetical protein